MLPLGYHRPAPALQRYVQFYAQRELVFRDPVFVHSVPARAAPMLEFTFGDRFKVLYSGSCMEEISPRAVIVGMLTRPHAQLRLQGSSQSFVIMFQPAGLQTLFAVPLNELTGRSYDAYSVLGKTIAELDLRLGECASFQSRVQTADEFLARRVPATPGRNFMTAAVRLIDCNKGRLRIPDLALTLDISQRQLERDFASAFGMRPKLFARIVRFQSALDCKARSTRTWTDVAHEFGYHDQMHLIHDFAELTTGTPTETLGVLELFFREQIALIQATTGAKELRLVPRFVI